MTEANDAKDFARRVHRDPELMQVVRNLAPAFARIGRRQTSDEVYVAMQPAIVLWGAPYADEPNDAHREGMQRSWMKVYFDALNWLPKEALDFAVAEWIRVGKPYFPKPSELVKLASPMAERVHKVCWWIKKAAEEVPEKRAEEDPAKKAEIERWLQDLRAGGGGLGSTFVADRHRVGA